MEKSFSLRSDLSSDNTELNFSFYSVADNCQIKKSYKLYFLLLKILRLNCRTFFKIYSLLYICNPNNSTKKNSKTRKFRKTLANTFEILSKLYTNSLKSSFFFIPKKSYKAKMPVKKKSYAEKKNLLKVAVIEMIKKGRTNTEQRGFWKWMINVKESNTKLFPIKKNIRISNLLKTMANNLNSRTYVLVKSRFYAWSYIAKTLTLSHKQIYARTTVAINLVELVDRSISSCKIRVFQKFKNNLTGKKKNEIKAYNGYKPYISCISHIVHKSLLNALNYFKIKCMELKIHNDNSTSVQLKVFPMLSKPLVPLETRVFNKKKTKTLILNLFHIIKQTLRCYWQEWATKRKPYVEMNISSTESTLELSNFILPPEKISKLTILTKELAKIARSRTNMSHIALSEWTYKSYKKHLSTINIKIILKNQSTKKDAQKTALTVMGLACRIQKEFTDID